MDTVRALVGILRCVVDNVRALDGTLCCVVDNIRALDGTVPCVVGNKSCSGGTSGLSADWVQKPWNSRWNIYGTLLRLLGAELFQ